MTILEKIIAVPALKDNYIWLFFDETTRDAWAVDPGEALPLIHALEQYQLQLKGIFITHHHYDHSGGVPDLIQYAGPLEVIGSHKSRLNCITRPVKEHDVVQAGPFSIRVLEIPGHTLDHVAYFNDEMVFSGDTLFSAGCGRIFEGTPPQMYHSLQKILALPDDLSMYCGHEYTLANLAFAQTVEPKNQDIAQKRELVYECREHQRPSLPSRLSEERKINPFLRCEEATVQQAVAEHFNQPLQGPVEVFTHLRTWKNSI